MELEEYLTIIWRRKFVVLITTLFATMVVLAGTFFYPTTYEATAILRIAASRSGEVTYEELLYVDRLLRTFARVAASSSMEEEVTRRLGLSESPKIRTEVLPNTELIQVTVEHSDPDIAREAADTLVEMIIGDSQQLGSRDNPLTIVDRATTSQDSDLLPLIILISGAFVGFIGGLGLAFMLENLDKTLYENRQIESVSNLPTLGKIPKVSHKQTILSSNQSPQYLIQAFHILRANILMQNSREPFKSFLVVSADPQEGKSTIVANLAYSITQAGKKVVIIDGDLRRPKMHNIFHIPNEVGLSNILADDLGVDDALQMTEAGIFVIPSGPIPPDPILLLDCEKVAGLMTELRKQYDTILVDAPSLLAVPDAKLLAHHVDGLIMVINRAATSEDTLQLGLEYIKDMHAEPIGIVINRAEIIDGYYLYH